MISLQEIEDTAIQLLCAICKPFVLELVREMGVLRISLVAVRLRFIVIGTSYAAQ